MNPVLNQFVAVSSLALAAITGKVRGLLGTSDNSSLPVLDQEIIRERERQSIRIKLRMLAHTNQLDELMQIAETTDIEEMSRVAVMEIDEATEGNLEYLEKLARGRSRSTVRAIVRVFNRKNTRLAKEIFMQHLQDGAFSELVGSGTVKLFSILDLLGVFEQSLGDESLLGHFLQLWKRLDESPFARNRVLSEILGDPEPGGFRCVYDASLIPHIIRVKALELLQLEDPIGCERACLYATNDEADDVAYPAAAWLYNYWQADGMIPTGIDPMPMLNVNSLYQLCSMTTSFQWGDSEQADDQVKALNQMKDELAVCSKAADAQAFTNLERQIEDIERELKKTTERRINRLQPLVDGLCAALRLPNPKLLPSDDDGSEASYLVGMGVIKIARHNLLTDKPLSERLMSALLHEICHLEQDVLIIRKIADDLNMKFGQHGKLLIPLWNKYSDGVGYAPDNVFLLAVLRLRGEQRLSEEERSRAEKLYDDALKLNSIGEEIKSVNKRGAHLEQSLDGLRQGAFDACLLTVLRDQHKLDKLFQSGRIPKALVQELDFCQRQLESAVRTSVPNARDTIETAMKLLGTEADCDIVPVVIRLKRLLYEVLEEELKILRRKLSRLKREGYQEAEAYLVSDRADVIIKAIRRGWFQINHAQ